MLLVPRRKRVLGWRDSVLAPNPPVFALGNALTAADIAENLSGPFIRFSLGW